jgi:hypothetical protein
MKAVVRNSDWFDTTSYDYYLDSNKTNVTEAYGMEMDLLELVLDQLKTTFVHVPTPEGFESDEGLTNNLISAMIAKEVYIALGAVGTHYLNHPFLDSTNSYHTMRLRWYVPCSVKYPRWSSIFRILSVELWLVLIISIVIAAISVTLVGRYSCTSEWQGYKTLRSSLTNVWAVILGVAVSKMPRKPSLRSLFLSWVCFSMAFSTVFQAFLTTFLVDSGYKKPIQNKDELYESGIKLQYPPDFNFIFENDKETEVSKVKEKSANCQSYSDCIDWAKYHRNVAILYSDLEMKIYFAGGSMFGENSEPLLCGLEDGVVYNDGLRMLMFHGDPLLRRVTEIIDRVFEAGIYNFWISQYMHEVKVETGEISLVHPLDQYYSFNLYHMQPAFYLLLIGWCLSALCFMVELLYNYVLNKRK